VTGPSPHLVLLALVAVSLAGSSPCGAQIRDEHTLLREGFLARRAQRDADALHAFEAALAIARRGSTLAQIALAEYALGRWSAAESHLVAALASDDPWVARNATTLRASLAAVRAHLASLALEDGPDGATVHLDGREVATLPLHEPLRLPTGTVRLRVTATGYHPLERTLTVAAGETLRESVALAPTPPPTPSPPPTSPGLSVVTVRPAVAVPSAPVVPRDVGAGSWASRALVIGGGASLGAAVALSLLRSAAVNDLRAWCRATDLAATDAVECAPDAEARGIHQRASVYRDLSWVAAGVGASAALAGIVWWAVSASGRRAVSVRAASHGTMVAWSF